MDVDFSCTTSREAYEQGRKIGERFVQSLQNKLRNTFFGDGIDKFVITIVMVDSDDEKNKNFVGESHSVRRWKDLRTNAWVRCLGVALLFNPDEMVKLDIDIAYSVAKEKLIYILQNIDIKLPRKFLYNDFLKEVSEALL